VDLIRARTVPEVIRRNGAEGKLPLPPAEIIEVLVFLSQETDHDLQQKAFATLESWDEAEFCSVLADPATSPETLEFAAERLSPTREVLRDILLQNPNLPATARSLLLQEHSAGTQPPDPLSDADQAAVEILAKLAAGAKVEDVIATEVEPPPEAMMRDDELTSRDRETLIQKIGRMTVVEKIKAALTGNMETRALLIRDSNKIISRAVLQSPKISETEAEGYAAAKNVSDEVLRLIAGARRFRKSYTVIRALVNNPRAPIDVTIPLMVRINDKDLKGLSLNRNVPEVIRSLAIKKIKQKEEAGRGKLFNKD
jgi:hypothetical protein